MTQGTKSKGKSEPTAEERAQKKAKRQEDNRRRFVELAPKRVNATITSLRRVKNLANKQGYVYSEEEAQKITTALQDALDAVKQAFSSETGGQDAFSL